MRGMSACPAQKKEILMNDIITSILSYPFMVRALVVGTLVALCAALLGVSLVLKRFSMIGDGLSHVGFGALAIASALNTQPLLIAVPIVIAGAFLLLRMNRADKMSGDSATALLSTGALAIGVMVISMSSGMNTNVYNYLFGSILGMSSQDVVLSVVISVVVLIVFVLFYNRIFAVTFDESFAAATGTRIQLYNSVLAILTALVIVVGMRIMGSLLISSLIVFPALTSMLLCRRFFSVMICSSVISVVCLLAGLILSYVLAAPAGASIVLCNLIVYGVFRLLSLFHSIPRTL